MSQAKPIAVRLATPADAAIVAQLNQAFNGVVTPPDVMATRLVHCAKTEWVFLAEVDSQPAGFACLWLFPVVCYGSPYAEVSELYVEPSFRRRGVGRALVMAAVQAAREQGGQEICLNTGFGNAGAQAFYRSLGFVDDALHMRQSLKNHAELQTENTA